MRRPLLLSLCAVAAGALAACTSTQDVLEPSAIAAAPPTTAGIGQGDAGMPVQQTTSTEAAKPLSAAVASKTRLRLDPIVGATVDAATPLSERLNSQARSRGMNIAGSTDPNATHVLKGYFSTITEGKETTVIYVWDVYDPAGNRLHRINGQQKAAANGAEGWASVTPAMMQAIADSTINQLSAWLAARST